MDVPWFQRHPLVDMGLSTVPVPFKHPHTMVQVLFPIHLCLHVTTSLDYCWPSTKTEWPATDWTWSWDYWR